MNRTHVIRKVAVAGYVLLVATLAAATFVEQEMGTGVAEEHIYHAGWFILLWGMFSVLAVAVCFRGQIRRLLPLAMLHGSFGVILAGALTTYTTGERGYVHLHEGETVGSFVSEGGGAVRPLPFTLRLDSFRVKCYPGTDMPADYVSYVRIEQRVPADGRTSAGEGEETFRSTVSMNRILICQGYRFCQTSYDRDGQGSLLSVNHDPWGIGLTYTGYALFGLSVMGMIGHRRSGFRRLLRHPMWRKGSLAGLFLLLAVPSVQAEGRLPVLTLRQADSLASVQVIYGGRVVPFNTLARDFVQKIYGKPSYKGLTPEQVVGGWLLCPDIWRDEPMFRLKKKELRDRLGLSETYVRLTDLFDGSAYRLQSLWDAVLVEGAQASPLGKAIQETDEQVGLVQMLLNGTLIRPLPSDGSLKPLSPAKLRAELWYNRIPFSRVLFPFNLLAALFAFVWLLRADAGRRSQACIGWLLIGGLYAALLFHLTGYALRWYIAGRVPLSNGYETMQFLALVALLLAALFRRRMPFALPFGFLLSGITLLVAHLGEANPQITPLMPVLHSPWLSSHVSFIMLSYALFAFQMLNGVLALCLPRHAVRLMRVSRLLLYPAVFCLGAGIFLGAVWANVSWGRYWAWDPKEVWALITFLVYAVPFHVHSLPAFRRPRMFHLYMLFAFLTVLMTYWGVNSLLGGMHSYG